MDMILGYLHSGLSAVVPFVVLLGLLIFVHEMGHFLVAKFFGVRVEVFSMGFGKKIFQYKRGDTIYAISLFPIGGYVKMFGDDLNADISEEDKKHSFTHKPVFQRIGVVLAGPLMNFFFAILILFVVALIGEQMKSPIIGDISAETTAYQAGFRSGDKILKAGGKSIQTWDQFQKLMNANSGQNLQVEVQREASDQVTNFEVTPKLAPNPNTLSLEESVGDIDGLTLVSKASIVGITPDSVAAKAGLQSGDLIKAVGGHPVKYFRELDNIFVQLQGQPIRVDAERYAGLADGATPTPIKIEIPASQFAAAATLGIESGDLYLAKIMDSSPAQAAGLKEGDHILQVNQTVPKKWEDVLLAVKSFKGDGVIAFDVERAGQKMHFDITPRMTSQVNQQNGSEDKRFTVGIVPWAFSANPETTLVKARGVGSALKRGWDKTIEITDMTVVSFLRLIQAKISPKSLGGVISIGQAASETFKIGIAPYLQMMAVISINLFILNLLPIPVLDGGHFLFYVIEAVRGVPVSMRKMEIAQQVGLVVLMSLMVFALFNDFTRLIASW